MSDYQNSDTAKWDADQVRRQTGETQKAAKGKKKRRFGWLIYLACVIVGSCLLRIAFIFWVFPSMNDYTSLMNIYPITWIVTGTTMIALFFFARHRAYAGVRQAQAQAAKHHIIAEI